MKNIKLALAQYPIDEFSTWCDFVEKIEAWVAKAVSNKANLLVFPEYASMELCSLSATQQTLKESLVFVQTFLSAYQSLFQLLAEQHQLHILAGSFPVAVEAGYVNRAYFFYPDGRMDFQDKIQMTRFEKETWFISGATELKVFSTELGRIAVNVCYDNEFPMLARQQAEQGALLILAPSCTDTLAGYHRVRIGCQARALENQCYVAQSPTVGLAAWSQALDVNIGKAAVYTPVDVGFPDNGVLAEGEMNQAQWLYAELALENIATVRQVGQVTNFDDWPLQFNATLDNRQKSRD